MLDSIATHDAWFQTICVSINLPCMGTHTMIKTLLIRMDHYYRVIHRVIFGCFMHTLTEMSNILLSMPQSFVYAADILSHFYFSH